MSTDRSEVDVVDRTPTSPVVVHVPHSSRTVPAWAGLGIGGAELAEELDALTDAHTDLIARTAGTVASLFINRLSRLVVDPERFPDAREEMLAVGMGPVYTHGHAGRRLRGTVDGVLVREVHAPYADRFTDLVRAALARHGRAVVIDLHSYPLAALPYELHGSDPRPQIRLGFDEFHTGTPVRQAALSAFANFETGVNTPFSGTYVPLPFFGRQARVQSVMVEIRRDTYLGDDLSPDPPGVQRLADALRDLVGRCAGV